jgi:hypothetical protein
MKKLVKEYSEQFVRTKPRSIKKLLIILRDNLDKYMKPHLLNNGYFSSGCTGLCICAWELEILEIITTEEEEILSSWLEKNLPERKYGMYCWKQRFIEPRKLWLNKQIEKLNKK